MTEFDDDVIDFATFEADLTEREAEMVDRLQSNLIERADPDVSNTEEKAKEVALLMVKQERSSARSFEKLQEGIDSPDDHNPDEVVDALESDIELSESIRERVGNLGVYENYRK